METASPIALTSVKSGKPSSPLCQHSCLEFGQVNAHVVLGTWPEYVPMVTTTPFRDQLERSQHFRRSGQLFVCYGGQRKGKAVSKQRISHWLVDMIRTAYQARGLPCPLGVRTHSTRGITALAALANGASLTDIYRAAGWATLNTLANLRMEPVFSKFPDVNPEHLLHHLALLDVAEFGRGTRCKNPTQADSTFQGPVYCWGSSLTTVVDKDSSQTPLRGQEEDVFNKAWEGLDFLLVKMRFLPFTHLETDS
ncbi:Rhamnulokinase [Labeo rohita]|uniref:Rhamnulokinase n=1 Tax=Labeo rohita TaxID=84645 RepID=A0ABQ8M405_LABRO|nr:Rhamnulokinase [Labeo rohita]